MYELTEDQDLGFLIGKTLIQVCLGQFQNQLRFGGDVEIAFESGFVLDGTSYSGSDAHLLHRLLGASVRSWRVLDRRHLELMMENDGRLVILNDTDEAESFVITTPNETIVA